MFRPALSSDAAALCAIYNPYVLGTTITFEEEAVTEADMAGRIQKLQESHPWIVLEDDGRVLGYAYGSTWRTRAAYRFSTETAIYLAEEARGRGRGEQLYRALLEELRERGFHLALGGLALPNAPSVALHEKLGFLKVGHMKEAGWKFGAWIDVGFWQLQL
jgi:phosphinothricin acetyltransferase